MSLRRCFASSGDFAVFGGGGLLVAVLPDRRVHDRCHGRLGDDLGRGPDLRGGILDGLAEPEVDDGLAPEGEGGELLLRARLVLHPRQRREHVVNDRRLTVVSARK